jgi:hypothetical protein
MGESDLINSVDGDLVWVLKDRTPSPVRRSDPRSIYYRSKPVSFTNSIFGSFGYVVSV